MKRDAKFPPAVRRSSTLGLVALLSCCVALGASDAVATTPASLSSTQAQQLSNAVRACRRQLRIKRAACVRRARNQYARHHTVIRPRGPVAPPLHG